MIRHSLMALMLASLLPACGTSTAVLRYSESKSAFRKGPVLMSHNYPGEDIYRLYVRGATGFVTISTLRDELEERAERFCARQGKSLVVLGEKISPPPYILGNFPRIEIVFAAVPRR